MIVLRIVASLILVAEPVTAFAQPKPTIVLVHGAWETSDIWGYVIKKLMADGFKVTNVNLPGRPGNPAPMNDVSLALHQQTVAQAIVREARPVVLVGHSFGGFTISAEAEAEPAKIKTLVYIAAYVPQSGQSLLSLATTDGGSKAGPALDIEEDKGFSGIRYDARADLFGNGAPPEVGAAIAKSIVDEPLGPLAAPITLTPSRFGGEDKVYIHTMKDQVVSPPFQALMVGKTPMRLELSINTGHAPFITAPQELAGDIEQAAQ